MQSLAPAMILVPGHRSSGCSGNDRAQSPPWLLSPARTHASDCRAEGDGRAG